MAPHSPDLIRTLLVNLYFLMQFMLSFGLRDMSRVRSDKTRHCDNVTALEKKKICELLHEESLLSFLTQCVLVENILTVLKQIEDCCLIISLFLLAPLLSNSHAKLNGSLCFSYTGRSNLTVVKKCVVEFGAHLKVIS